MSFQSNFPWGAILAVWAVKFAINMASHVSFLSFYVIKHIPTCGIVIHPCFVVLLRIVVVLYWYHLLFTLETIGDLL